jgi:hypothetical protein
MVTITTSDAFIITINNEVTYVMQCSQYRRVFYQVSHIISSIFYIQNSI